MWKWFNCYLSGRHNFGVSCEPGAIFLKCSHCGRRSPGWAFDQKGHVPAPSTQISSSSSSPSIAAPKPKVKTTRRALPISGVAAS